MWLDTVLLFKKYKGINFEQALRYSCELLQMITSKKLKVDFSKR